MPATDLLLPVPQGNYLKWCIDHPEQVAAYLETVAALQNLSISVTKSGVTTNYPVRISAKNAVIAINV